MRVSIFIAEQALRQAVRGKKSITVLVDKGVLSLITEEDLKKSTSTKKTVKK